jgi:hypothetical protein
MSQNSHLELKLHNVVVHSRDQKFQNWTQDVLKNNGEIMSFEEYMDKLLPSQPRAELKLGWYTGLLKQWFG